MNKKILVLLSVILVVILYFILTPEKPKDSKIENVFGISFGQQVNPDDFKRISAHPLPDLYLILEFKPDEPIENTGFFSPKIYYRMWITPMTHQVYRISLRGKSNSMEDCLQKIRNLKEYMHSKYTEGAVTFSLSGQGTTPTNKKINLSCDSEYLLTAAFTDLDLLEVNKRESIYISRHKNS